MEKMSKILTFINENWFLIMIAIAFISSIAIKIYKWFKMPNSEQMKKVQEWLLYAVAKAEEKLGSGTGELKLRYVYDMFIAKFPAIAIFVDFDEFKIMVEKALEKFEGLIQTNESIGALYAYEDMRGEDSDE